jgi:hypothetical protein
MSELSRTDKILVEKTVCVLLVRGESTNGEPVYAYVGVRANKLDDFIKAQSAGTFYPEDHGVVIASGVGEPTDEVKQRMETDYGFDHAAMTSVPDAESANQVAVELAQGIRKQHDAE